MTFIVGDYLGKALSFIDDVVHEGGDYQEIVLDKWFLSFLENLRQNKCNLGWNTNRNNGHYLFTQTFNLPSHQ